MHQIDKAIDANKQEVIRRVEGATTQMVNTAPVDTGYYRSRFEIQIDRKNRRKLPRPKRKSYMIQYPKVSKFPDKFFFITNRVPYAQFIEFGNSKRSGLFIMTRAIRDWFHSHG